MLLRKVSGLPPNYKASQPRRTYSLCSLFVYMCVNLYLSRQGEETDEGVCDEDAKGVQVTRGWRELHNGELLNLYPAPI
jgi:hypothetical protein